MTVAAIDVATSVQQALDSFFEIAPEIVTITYAALIGGVFLAMALARESEATIGTGGSRERIPIDEGTLTTGGLVALAAAAVAGGKAGTHFHRKFDNVGI